MVTKISPHTATCRDTRLIFGFLEAIKKIIDFSFCLGVQNDVAPLAIILVYNILVYMA